MLKKTAIIGVLVIMLLVGVCTMAFAAQNVANISQKGSLLIFPLIEVYWERGAVVRDTIVQIGNDFPRSVQLKCFWVDSWQNTHDFSLNITQNQPLWFRASDGSGYDGPSAGVAGIGEGRPVEGNPDLSVAAGELRCWATNFTEMQQVVWNHLYGSAIVYDVGQMQVFEYGAYAFTARDTDANPEFNPWGKPGVLNLNGKNATVANNVSNQGYDACPAYLVFNFFGNDVKGASQDADQIRFGKNDLTLVPCKQDLRQERLPTCTKAKFDVWNENERKLTGAYQCIKCWFEGTLDEIGTLFLPYSNPNKSSGFGGTYFTRDGLKTDLGRMRITGVKSTPVCSGVFVDKDPLTGKLRDVCVGPEGKDLQVNTPLLAVLSSEIAFNRGGWKRIGITATTAGAYAPAAGEAVQILYDPETSAVPQSPGR